MAAFHWLLSIWLCFTVSTATDDVKKTVEVNTDATSLDKHDDPDELMRKKLEMLQTQVLELENHLRGQQVIINELNDTLQTFVFTSDEYGVIYDKSDDRPLLLTSLHAHDVPFVMLNVISVRLPKRDSYVKKKKKKGSGRAVGRERKRAKTRYVHVIITLSRDGIFQMWDDEQNELYTYFDTSILPQDSTDDELINSNQNFVVYSDIVTQNKYGNTWFVMARNDAAFVKVYAVAAWRDYVDDKINRNVRKSVISGQITPENTIYRPTDAELDKFKAEQAKRRKKATYRRSAAKRTKMHKKTEQDINEFDVGATETNENAQCDKKDGECDANQMVEETQHETEEESVEQNEEESIEIAVKNATVTGVTVYQQMKRKYIIVSYSDGKVFSFKPNGDLASSASSIPYIAPNKTIVAITTTQKKYEMLVVTEAGFQFLKLPKLTKTGPFCHLPQDTTINAINFDTTSTTLMYLGTTDGRLLIYNTRKLNKKTCKSLDTFTIHPDSPLQIDTLPGYLLVTSSLGLHVYNVSKKKTSPYHRPGLVFVRKFEDEFEDNDARLASSNVLVSSYTDPQQRTLIAYVQSASNVSLDTDDNDISYRFVVMESYLPSFRPSTDRGGVLGIISKAPIFVGVAMFAFFWVFFKGKSGGNSSFGNSPLGRLGKIFGGRGKRKRDTFSRGGSRDVYGKKERWEQRHAGGRGGSSSGRSGPKLSANMRYGNRQPSRKSGAGFKAPGPSYKRGGGFAGGDWSD